MARRTQRELGVLRNVMPKYCEMSRLQKCTVPPLISDWQAGMDVDGLAVKYSLDRGDVATLLGIYRDRPCVFDLARGRDDSKGTAQISVGTTSGGR